MGRTCSAPGCNTGYRSCKEKRTSFSFPDDKNLRFKWLSAIHRSADFVISKNSCVCILHFNESQIIRTVKKKNNEGILEDVELERPRLIPDAVPCVFPNQPKYFTVAPPTQRKAPEDRRQLMIERDEADFKNWIDADKIKSFEDFLENFSSRTQGLYEWKVYPDFVLLYKISASFNLVPEILCSIKIYHDLKIQVYYRGCCLRSSSFKGVLSKYDELKHWTAFETLLSHVNALSPTDVSTFEKDVEVLFNQVERILDVWTPTPENLSVDIEPSKLTKLHFLKEQIKLLTLTCPRYSSELILWSSSIFLSFPGAYLFIRNASTVLTLPHPSHIKRLTGGFKSEVGLSKDQMKYLATKCKGLQDDRERIVSLLFDEIHTESKVEYKGGKVFGIASNMLAATKIQAFMITSPTSKNEDIVALFPVNVTEAENLKEMTLVVLKALTDVGYIVITTICDNNRMNRSMYALLASGKLVSSIPNPFKPDSTIFLLFDTVHLLKCCRNNWFNQRTDGRTLIFPHIENDAVILSASVKHLEDIYHGEKNEIVKAAPALSQTALHPSSLERQNVNLALRIFDEKNIAALQESVGKSNVSGTAVFIESMLNWWRIVNVRAPFTGNHKRDSFREPIRSSDDKNLIYLSKFSDFLKKWRELKVPLEAMQFKPNPELKSNPKLKSSDTGKLTTDTFVAMQHTTDTLVKLCRYIFTSFKFDYILLGKFQTDRLEGRFGKYRQMSGCNYHVSVCQILESERKIKVLNLLTLKSASFGDFELMDLDLTDVPEEPENFDVNTFDNCLDASENIQISSSQEQILFHNGGFVSHSLLKYVSDCEDCVKVVRGDGDLEFEVKHNVTEEAKAYLRNLTRGGLKEPTSIIYDVTCMIYSVFQILISSEFQEKFLKVTSQRGLLKKLSLKKLEFMLDLEEACPSCGKTTKKILSRAAHTLSNIFMNNYCKIKNDKKRSHKRKLDTFS